MQDQAAAILAQANKSRGINETGGYFQNIFLHKKTWFMLQSQFLLKISKI